MGVDHQGSIAKGNSVKTGARQLEIVASSILTFKVARVSLRAAPIRHGYCRRCCFRAQRQGTLACRKHRDAIIATGHITLHAGGLERLGCRGWVHGVVVGDKRCSDEGIAVATGWRQAFAGLGEQLGRKAGVARPGRRYSMRLVNAAESCGYKGFSPHQDWPGGRLPAGSRARQSQFGRTDG